MIWNWIYGPRPPLWNPLGWVLWMLFGNWEDGPYGLYAAETTRLRDWRVAAKWWLRNPCHNIFFHLFPFAIPLWWSIVLLGTPEYPQAAFWPKTTGVVIALTPAPMIAWRSRNWEFYLGWRPMRQFKVRGLRKPDPAQSRLIGAFGMALRKGGYRP